MKIYVGPVAGIGDQPFLDLPNVIASPHNSAQGDGAQDISLRRAVENCRRALIGEGPPSPHRTR